MNPAPTRRTFLKTAAVAGLAAALPAVRAQVSADGLFPAKSNFHRSPAVSLMISGGAISREGRFLPALAAVQQAHFVGRKNILLVLHASIPADRDMMEQRLQAMFAAEKMDAVSLHHWSGLEARRRLETAEAIFIGGGETFLLLRTLQETKQLRVLRDQILSGTPVHGTSAGANIAGPHIGCTNDFPVVDVESRAALGVFPAVINPHHPRSDEPEHAGRAQKIRTYLRINPRETVLGLGNAAAARIHAGRVELTVGPGFYYDAAGQRELPLGEVPELTTRALYDA